MTKCSSVPMFRYVTFDNFDYCDRIITLPVNSVFYRGVPRGMPTDIVMKPDRLMYLTDSMDQAAAYGDVRTFVTKEPMKVMDIRKAFSLLRMIFDAWRDDSHTMLCLYTTFGQVTDIDTQSRVFDQVSRLTSENAMKNAANCFRSRVDEMKRTGGIMWNRQGVRVSIALLDAESYSVCKCLFGGVCDGIVAPRMATIESPEKPFQSEELVLFNPTKVVMVDPAAFDPFGGIRRLSISQLIGRQYHEVRLEYRKTAVLNSYLEGGGRLDRNSVFDCKGRPKQVTRAEQFVSRMRKEIAVKIESLPQLKNPYKPTPSKGCPHKLNGGTIRWDKLNLHISSK